MHSFLHHQLNTELLFADTIPPTEISHHMSAVFMFMLYMRVGQSSQCGSEGGDVPVFNHPALTGDEFHAPSLSSRGSQAAPKRYLTHGWASTRLVQFLGLLPVVHSIVLRCLWLLWCDPVWPLCT